MVRKRKKLKAISKAKRETGKRLFKFKTKTAQEIGSSFRSRRELLLARLRNNPRTPPIVLARAIANVEGLTGKDKVDRIKEIIRRRS